MSGPGVVANFLALGRVQPHVAGTTLNMTASRIQHHWFDSTGAQNNAQLPTGPSDGDIVVLKMTGATVAAPLLITARGGATVELIGTGAGPGSFSAANGQTNFSAQGGSLILIYSSQQGGWGVVAAWQA